MMRLNSEFTWLECCTCDHRSLVRLLPAVLSSMATNKPLAQKASVNQAG